VTGNKGNSSCKVVTLDGNVKIPDTLRGVMGAAIGQTFRLHFISKPDPVDVLLQCLTFRRYFIILRSLFINKYHYIVCMEPG
jgi:hypothetical protein